MVDTPNRRGQQEPDADDLDSQLDRQRLEDFESFEDYEGGGDDLWPDELDGLGAFDDPDYGGLNE